MAEIEAAVRLKVGEERLRAAVPLQGQTAGERSHRLEVAGDAAFKHCDEGGEVGERAGVDRFAAGAVPAVLEAFEVCEVTQPVTSGHSGCGWLASTVHLLTGCRGNCGSGG